MKLKVKLGSAINAALFSKICTGYENVDIDVACGRYIIDGKSVLGVLSISPDHICDVTFNSNNAELQKKFREDMRLWIVEE